MLYLIHSIFYISYGFNPPFHILFLSILFSLIRTIANYMMWRVVKLKFLQLSSDFVELFKYYYLQAFNYWSDSDQHQLCLMATSQKFGIPLSKVFLDQKFFGDSKELVSEKGSQRKLQARVINWVSSSLLLNSLIIIHLGKGHHWKHPRGIHLQHWKTRLDGWKNTEGGRREGEVPEMLDCSLFHFSDTRYNRLVLFP